jgi:xanthine/uracil permease/anti-sigma regulatory factor (Ser/Thr protein kinase)
VFAIYPAAIAQKVGMTPLQKAGLLTATIIATAITTFLHHFKPPLGNGNLTVQTPTPVVVPALMQAAGIGGLPLLAGMSIIFGATELAVSRVIKYLRAYFPPEVSGVVVMMLGVSLAESAVRNFSGATMSAGVVTSVNRDYILVASLTLATIIACAVFGKGIIKLFSLGFGLAVGLITSKLVGAFNPVDIANISASPWVGLPTINLAVPAFDVALIPLVVIMAVIQCVDTLGSFISIQRINDEDWKKLDTDQAAAGIQANGIGNMLSGFIGGMPGGISSAHIGLVMASGAAARRVGAFTGILLMFSIFTPKLVAGLSSIPQPVIGALLAYTAAFMMVAGMELILSRLLSERRIFTVGLSVLIGLSTVILPGVYSHLPILLANVCESTLAITAVSAILLNMLFRIGISRRAELPANPDGHHYETIAPFMDRIGKDWGARRDIVDKASTACAETFEALAAHEVPSGDVTLSVEFDEVDLVMTFTYPGKPLVIPTERPSLQDLIAETDAPAQLGGYIVRKYVDRLSQTRSGDLNKLILKLEH